MRPKHVSHHRLAHLHTPELLEDFDQIEEAENEYVRQVQHGHSFAADGMTDAKPSHGRIYSL